VDSDGPGAGATTLKTRYLLGDVVDQVLAQENVPASEVLWLLQDNLGSVRETVKNDGTVNSRVDFDPFGNMISIIDPSNGGAATTLKTRLNFTGQEYDADLKLVWYSDGTGPGRWYDPATGTFISEDPLGFLAGDANLDRYVGNAATYAVDPSGRDLFSPYYNPFYDPDTDEPTEGDFVAQLRELSNQWRGQGYDFAADLLDTFLSRKNARVGELIDFSQHAGKVRNDNTFLTEAQHYFTGLARKYAKPCETVTVSLPDKDVSLGERNAAFGVRWYPLLGGELFYALGGARVGYKDATLTVCLEPVSKLA
jgi:RHS repeat-associated protein